MPNHCSGTVTESHSNLCSYYILDTCLQIILSWPENKATNNYVLSGYTYLGVRGFMEDPVLPCTFPYRKVLIVG